MSETTQKISSVQGAGLGLKRELIPQIQKVFEQPFIQNIQFLEIAPENWINMGSKMANQLDWFRARYPLVCHGLCLSLGGLAPLNIDFLKQVKGFLKQYEMTIYTEHLSYATDGFQGQQGYLYDLLPIPFTEEAVHYVATRIRQTQDILEMKIGIENTSFYVHAPISTMDEMTFLNAVLSEADCLLHLDINNIYVNSVNFKFDAESYINKIPKNRIVYSHIAGHFQESKNLLVDTHGADVIDPVWKLLEYAYEKLGVFPTLLERDNAIPPLEILVKEINQIADYQNKHSIMQSLLHQKAVLA